MNENIAQSQSQTQTDNEAAQRAALEAISIGRETASSLSRQRETLKNSESILQDHKYILDRSNRVLRGMTWTGWVTNMITPDVKKPSDENTFARSHEIIPPKLHLIENVEALSPQLRPSAQAMKNFLCNIQMLNACKDPDQYTSIIQVCNHLQRLAAQEWDSLESKPWSTFKTSHMHKQLGEEFIRIYQYYKVVQKQKRDHIHATKLVVPTIDHNVNSTISIQPHPQHSPSLQNSNLKPKSQTEQEQDTHLNFLSTSLRELKSMGSSMNESIEQQNKGIDFIQSQSESLSNQTRMLIRKADRMTKWKMFQTPVFQSFQMILHVPTNTYLSVKENSLLLSSQFLGDASIFGIWKSSSKRSLIGFQNKQSQKWLGQSTFFKSIVCSSSSLGRFEEWELEDKGHSEKTALVCANANWGNGGWFVFDDKGNTSQIQTIESKNKVKCKIWSIVDVPK